MNATTRWLRRTLGALLTLVVLLVFAFWLFLIWPQRQPHPPTMLPKGTLAIEHARIYTSPNDPVIPDGDILIVDGRIAQVGPQVAVPTNATIVPCNQCTVTAGFWNAHVHFTEPKWTAANWKSASELNAQLADMLTSRGFTTVVDTGSNFIDTIPLRRRIESGELAGPYIYTAEAAIYPPHGIPFYLQDTLPHWLQLLMPQPNTPEDAVKDVQRNIDRGADITKLFTGSWVGPKGHHYVLPMPLDIAQAAARRSHQDGHLVFSHPSNLAGIQIAIQSGVDVLAHAADSTEGVDRALLQSIVDHKMATIPTLKMFGTTVTHDPSYLNPIYAEVRQIHQLGGTLIFGTDVGYMRDYSTEDEFQALAQCGLSATDVLAMLTTNPATRFGVLDQKGTITPGKLADLTLLNADPFTAHTLTSFSKVQTTIRSGKILYQR